MIDETLKVEPAIGKFEVIDVLGPDFNGRAKTYYTLTKCTEMDKDNPVKFIYVSPQTGKWETWIADFNKDYSKQLLK